MPRARTIVKGITLNIRVIIIIFQYYNYLYCFVNNFRLRLLESKQIEKCFFTDNVIVSYFIILFWPYLATVFYICILTESTIDKNIVPSVA